MLNVVKNPEYFWTYEDWDEETQDYQFKSEQAAIDRADEDYYQHCLSTGYGGRVYVWIKKYYFDDNGEKIFVEEKPLQLYVAHSKSEGW